MNLKYVCDIGEINLAQLSLKKQLPVIYLYELFYFFLGVIFLLEKV